MIRIGFEYLVTGRVSFIILPNKVVERIPDNVILKFSLLCFPWNRIATGHMLSLVSFNPFVPL